MEDIRLADERYYETLIPDQQYETFDQILQEPDPYIRNYKINLFIDREEERIMFQSERNLNANFQEQFYQNVEDLSAIAKQKKFERDVENLKKIQQEEERLFREKIKNIKLPEKIDHERLERENNVKDLLNFVKLKRPRQLPQDSDKFVNILDEIEKYIEGTEAIDKSSIQFLYSYGLKDKMIQNIDLYENVSEEESEYEYEENY